MRYFRYACARVGAWLKAAGHSAKGSWVRQLLFWPVMALAAVLIYTGWVPIAWRQMAAVPSVDYRAGLPASPRETQPPAPDIAIDVTPKVTPEVETAPVRAEEDGSADPIAAALARLAPFEPAQAVLPVSGRVVRPYGWYRHPEFSDWRMSPGVEIAPAPAAAVQAAYAGVVTQVVKEESGDTWQVTVTHPDGWQTEYGGLHELLVQPHAVVNAGQVIGRAAPDPAQPVSYVLRYRDATVDPAPYLPEQAETQS